MNFAARILKWAGWSVNITVPDYPKCLICVAPHTSNWDFILGKLAYASVGRHAGFLMKSTWFFPPLGWIFRAIGGIPVNQRKSTSLTQTVARKFEETERLHIAVTPEGTRSRVCRWRTGFLHIAVMADVPIVLGVLDFGNRTITVDTTFNPTGDIEADMAAIKKFYRARNPRGRYPAKFCAE